MRSWGLAVLLCVSIATLGCGGGTSSSAAPAPGSSLSGNWLITLNRVNNTVPLTYSGFLLQKGTSVSGSLILGDGCSGVGPVTGTLNDQDLQLVVNEFGQDLSLTGTFTSGTNGASAEGQFQTVVGGCSFQSTGNWSAIQVPPLTGAFHGTITFDPQASVPQPVIVNVNGTMTQGQNIGASNATLSGTMAITPPFSQQFCTIPPFMTITGVISGTSASFLFYDDNGNPLSNLRESATVAPDGTSLVTHEFSFPSQSKSCPALSNGDLQITFP